MNSNTCNTCIHYRQHYTFDQHGIFRVYCGHCTCLKVRSKRPDSPKCDHYTPCESKENAFAGKEYLSKALLEYMLKLELLPEIQNAEDYAKKEIKSSAAK